MLNKALYIVNFNPSCLLSLISKVEISKDFLMTSSILSSSSTSNINYRLSRYYLVRSIIGKYSFVPTSSENYALRKQKEIEQE